MFKVAKSTPSAILPLAFVLSTTNITNADENEKSPLRIVERLFDQRNPVTLGLPVIRAEHQVVYRATEDTYKFCHQQNLGVWKDKLYLMWSNGVTHEDHNGQRILYGSTEAGVHWSKPAVLAEDHDGLGPMACVSAGWHDAGDRLVAYYTAKANRGSTNETRCSI